MLHISYQTSFDTNYGFKNENKLKIQFQKMINKIQSMEPWTALMTCFAAIATKYSKVVISSSKTVDRIRSETQNIHIFVHFSVNSKPKMEALFRFNRCIFEWERSLLKLVGHDFLGGTFKKNLMTFTVYFIIVVSLGAMGYSIMFYDSLTKIFNLAFSLIALQVKVAFPHAFLSLFNLFLLLLEYD